MRWSRVSSSKRREFHGKEKGACEPLFLLQHSKLVWPVSCAFLPANFSQAKPSLVAIQKLLSIERQ
jgi:hypothetical protein